MGVDYRAIALIGLRVDEDVLLKEATVKAFKHNFGPEVLYHPKTGKALWEKVKQPVDTYDLDCQTYGDYEVIHDEHSNDYFIALRMAGDTDSNGGQAVDMSPLYMDELATDYEIFRRLMQDDCLWDEGEFGLWTVLSCE